MRGVTSFRTPNDDCNTATVEISVEPVAPNTFTATQGFGNAVTRTLGAAHRLAALRRLIPPMVSTAGPDAPALSIANTDAQLLFGVAQEFAWRHHNLPPGDRASAEHSHPCRLSYALNDSDGQLIMRIPIRELEQGLRQRRRALLRLLRSAGITWTPSRAAWYDLQQLNQAIKKQPRSVMALIWAISTGRPYPQPAIGRRQVLITVLLLLCLLIPGLVYIALLAKRQRRYQKELEQLTKQWRAAGMPEPNDTLLLSLISPPSAAAKPGAPSQPGVASDS